MELAKNTLSLVLSTLEKDPLSEIETSLDLNNEDRAVLYADIQGEKKLIQNKIMKQKGHYQRIEDQSVNGNASENSILHYDEKYEKSRKKFEELIRKEKAEVRKSRRNSKRRKILFDSVKDLASPNSGLFDKLHDVKTFYDALADNFHDSEDDSWLGKELQLVENDENIDHDTVEIINKIVESFSNKEKFYLSMRLQDDIDQRAPLQYATEDGIESQKQRENNSIIRFSESSSSGPKVRTNDGERNYYTIYESSPKDFSEQDLVEKFKLLLILFIRVSFIVFYLIVPIIHGVYLKFINDELIGFNSKNLNILLETAMKVLAIIERKLDYLKHDKKQRVNNDDSYPLASDYDGEYSSSLNEINEKFRNINRKYVTVDRDVSNWSDGVFPGNSHKRNTYNYTETQNTKSWKDAAFKFVVKKYVLNETTDNSSLSSERGSNSFVGFLGDFVTEQLK